MISVVLPVYNGERFLGDTLESISRQKLKDLEVVIIDDGSTDGSWNLITAWRDAQPFMVHAVRKPINYGVCAALVDATAIASGQYIAQIGHDDVWLPDHLLHLIDALERNPSAAAAFADVRYIDADGAALAGNIFDHGGLVTHTRQQLFARMLGGNYLCAPASMFRATHFKQTYWGVSNERLQDFELWLHLLLHGNFVSSERPTCFYRLHANNLSVGAQMRVQSEYELLGTLTRVLMGSDFGAYYRGIDDTAERLLFLDEMHTHLLRVTDYAPAIRCLHSIFLESLTVIETARPAHVHALRAELSLALGMFRKYLAITKLFPAHYLQREAPLPYLVRAHPGVVGSFGVLVEAGAFRDGSAVDLESTRAPYFFACEQKDVESHMKYPVFAEAVRARHLILLDAEATGSVDVGFSIRRDSQVDHALVDKIFRFFEEEHGSFMAGDLGATGEAQLSPTLLRRLYRRAGRMVPVRYRAQVAARARRILRRA